MQPNQDHHPDYNFIMNPAPKAKKRLFSGGDKKQRLLMGIIAGGLAVLVLGILLSSLFGGGSNSNDRLVGLIQRQTELVRVAELGQKDASATDAKNLAVNVKLSMLSAKNATTAALTKNGGKLNSKEVGLLKNTKTDETLAAAKQANRYDETFVSTLQSELTTYQQELSDVFEVAASQAEKALLQDLYNQTKVLTNTTE